MAAKVMDHEQTSKRGAMTAARRRKTGAMSARAVPHVRKFLAQRLRELRKQRGHTQEGLGQKASLSGKFIGEVERGEKSISIDGLYKVSVALEVPLTHLTDVRPGKRGVVPSEDAEKIFALVSGRHRPADIRKAYEILRTMLDKG
jgi:transcriptional regulator with XRE-family HTH domain